jgi:diphthamide biosynthesis protein 7
MSLSTFDTRYPADTTEFCPHPQAWNILACGTYDLTDRKADNGKQLRLGTCLIFDVDNDDLCVED